MTSWLELTDVEKTTAFTSNEQGKGQFKEGAHKYQE